MISEHIQDHYERYELYRKTLLRFIHGYNRVVSNHKIRRCAACFDILTDEDTLTCVQCNIQIHCQCAGVSFSTEPFLCDRCSFLSTCMNLQYAYN